MNVILVDDEIPALSDLENAVSEALPNASINSFSKARQALAFIDENTVDIAFLDINMRVFNGLVLAAKIQEKWHNANIIFCTGYGEYTADAMRLHASGYLMKPVSVNDIKEELKFLRFAVDDIQYLLNVRLGTDIEITDKAGNPVRFKRHLTKKLFTLLIAGNGKSISVDDICDHLWSSSNNNVYLNEKNKNYLMQLFVDLRKSLDHCGAADILKKDEAGYYADTSLIKITRL